MRASLHRAPALPARNGVLALSGLPTLAAFGPKEVMNVLRMDKKRVKESMNYILLTRIGQGVIKVIPIVQLEKLLKSIMTSR